MIAKFVRMYFKYIIYVIFQLQYGGIICPCRKNSLEYLYTEDFPEHLKIKGTAFFVLPLVIPNEVMTYSEFCNKIRFSEKKLMNTLKKKIIKKI